MTLSIHSSPLLNANAEPGQFTCPFCRRLAYLADGRRSLQEVARLLHLPAQVILKLAGAGVQEGWLTTPSAPHSDTFTALTDELAMVLGDQTQELLERALSMTRLSPETVNPKDVKDVLLALEFQLEDGVRESLTDTLQQLQLTYGL